MRGWAAVAGFGLAALAACAPSPLSENLRDIEPAAVERNWAARESLVTLTPRPGIELDALLLRSSGEAAGGIVILTGGAGRLDLRIRPKGWLGGNFLVRSRMHFAAEGFVVATLDSPSDQAGGMSHFRASAEHAIDLAAMVVRLRQETKGPIWLIGTSMGTVSAANGGRRGGAGADGIVLTATVTRPSNTYPFSVMDMPLEEIAVPVLLFHHRHDGCAVSPWNGLPYLSRRLVASPKSEIIGVSGGDPPRSIACEAFSAHGFLGIEARAVALMTNWMRAASR